MVTGTATRLLFWRTSASTWHRSSTTAFDSHRNSIGVLEWFEEHYEQATEKEFVRLGAVLEHFNADNQFEMSKQNFFKFVKEHPILAANFKRQQKVGGKVIKNVLVRCKPRAPSGA